MFRTRHHAQEVHMSKADIDAAKIPVQAWLDHRDTLIQALKDHDDAGQTVMADLVKASGGRHGPYRFKQGRLHFRKTRGSDGALRAVEESESDDM
jgi:hypothetical protein